MSIYVIFVEPQFTGNIGFLARTMANFGVKNLILVNPPELDDDAFRFSKHARYIVENAKVVKNLESASKMVDLLVGTSGVSTLSDKKFNRIALSPEEFANRAEDYAGRIGVVFGRENYGLYNHELEMCDMLITIPTSSEYPIMNITHAAAIILYEIFKHRAPVVERNFAEPMELELLNSRFSEILKRIEFPQHKRKNTEVMFRRIIGRAMLTKWEYHSMMGVLKRILYALDIKVK